MTDDRDPTQAPGVYEAFGYDLLRGDRDRALPINSTSLAYEKARTVKSGAGKLFGFSGYNSNAAAQFILVFDASQIPADGAVPVMIVTAAATAVFSAYWGSVGRSFDRGIILTNSSTGPTKTIGAADCWFDVQYV